MIECTCAREKILTICDSKKINILDFENSHTEAISKFFRRFENSHTEPISNF